MYRVALSLLVAPLALALSGCDDPFVTANPEMVHGTIELAAPGPDPAPRASALDITVLEGGIRGGRFPERVQDAGQWDFAVRVRDGQVVLMPTTAVDPQFRSRAAITQPLTGQTFEGVTEAPAAAAFVTDAPVPLVEGQVYVARSREFPHFFGTCLQYAKLQPTSVNPADGSVTLRVSTNAVCFDARLPGGFVEEGGA